MALGIGIDIGTVSVKLAVAADSESHGLLNDLAKNTDVFQPEQLELEDGVFVLLSKYRRIKGSPLDAIVSLLAAVGRPGAEHNVCAKATGAGARLVESLIAAKPLNEFSAITETVNALYPDVRTVFEMGGESSKYILLDRNTSEEPLGIRDYGTNGDCAAGTGSFMDQQASRLKYDITEIGDIVADADKAAQIAGRCSVFAKSDMIHAQQRGYKPDEVLKGLCNAVARNFKSAITRSKSIVPPVIFIGGVSMNSGMFTAIKDVFGLDDGDIRVPPVMNCFGAVGCALKSLREGPDVDMADIDNQDSRRIVSDWPAYDALSLDNVRLLRDAASSPPKKSSDGRVPAWLGIDIGSVSTNLVVVDAHGTVLSEIYTRTQARPIEVVGEKLRELARELGDRIDINGVGTTGSGRELIGILVGADAISDEITAHKTGAIHVSSSMLGREVDTIFEIGGQDSKYISIEDGIVVDFTMNDACAAGTGSFLEEQAEELDVSIIGEFAKVALSSQTPLRLGERCTVFMGRDVKSYLQRGASRQDIIAGLAYSVVHNYLNRVVRGRRIGKTIFFQGGTAYNDAVAAAFAKVTGQEIIVPPHNGVVGAIGAALLAKRKMDAVGGPSTFKGFDLERVDYDLREFTCKGCGNYCTVQEFTVDGEKTYWGDKCSERYRKRKKVQRNAILPDLAKVREELLLKCLEGNGSSGPVVGIPYAMYTYERLPFLATYLKECGFTVRLSDSTNREIANKGIESVVAEPCYPITVAHGHIQALFDEGVDYVLLPNIINAETKQPEQESYVCVWGSTLPFVAEHNSSFSEHVHKILKPTLHFRDGVSVLRRELFDTFGKLGVKRSVSNAALDKALAAQSAFAQALLREGEKAVRIVRESGQKAIVLAGRPYNIYDRTINLSVASKLMTSYGINVIPMDFLDQTDIDISAVNDNMYWSYGKKILQTATKLADDPRFDIIYITNFKCGPDSFVKQYVRDAIGRPFLVLQFDGHSNDAGVMTRCEAYLDSKGFLDTWEVRREQ